MLVASKSLGGAEDGDELAAHRAVELGPVVGYYEAAMVVLRLLRSSNSEFLLFEGNRFEIPIRAVS